MSDWVVLGLFSALCCLFWKYWKNRDAAAQYLQLKERMNSQKTITSGVPFNGVFEVHITVDPESNYVKLIDYIGNSKHHSMKIVYAVSTQKNNQYMLSYFTRK